MTLLLLSGFLIGMRHALEADHLAAIASLTSSTGTLKSAIQQGMIWGAGHTLALFFFCSIVIVSESIVPENMARGLELAVGMMLIVLGIDVIRRLLRDKIHFHFHQHGHEVHHLHAHHHQDQNDHSLSAHNHEHHRGNGLKALYIGLMHGLAGSAALIILTVQSVQSVTLSLVYILIFGIGSILGMAILSIVIALPMRYSARKLGWLNSGLQSVIGIFTIVLGSAIVIEFL